MSQETRWLPSPKAEDPHTPRPNKLAPRDLARTLTLVHQEAHRGIDTADWNSPNARHLRKGEMTCVAGGGVLQSNEERRLTLHRTPASILGIPV